MLTFGSIINGAFRHFRERPLAVLIWAALYMIVTFGYSLLMMPMMAGRMADMQNGSPAAVAGFFGLMLPFYLVIIVLTLVQIAASLRTLLRQGEESFAGMRIGMDELRLLGLFALLGIGLFVLMLVGSIVFGAVGGVLAMIVVGSASSSASPLAFLLVFLPMLAFFGGMIFLMVRLSLVSALTILRRKIIIGESWRLTRGHFWRLFGAYFVLGLMLFVLAILVMLITIGPAYFDVFARGFSPDRLAAAQQAQLQSQFGGLTVMGVARAVANGVLVGLSYAIWAGAAATATQDLIGRTDANLAETFA
jgi:hypothetical protein